MDIQNQIDNLPNDLKKAINHIDKSWQIEGYTLTDEDKQILINIANDKTNAKNEIDKILSKYKKISCTLFEKNDNTIKEINTYYYDNDKEIKIDDFLKDISFNIDDYESKCKSFKNGSLYLEIKAVTVDDKVDIHKIPLVLKDNCK